MRLALVPWLSRPEYLWAWQQTIGSGLCDRLHAEGRKNDRVCSYSISAEGGWFEETAEKESRSNDVDGK